MYSTLAIYLRFSRLIYVARGAGDNTRPHGGESSCPGAAARLGPLGAILHSLYETNRNTPTEAPIGRIGRNSLAMGTRRAHPVTRKVIVPLHYYVRGNGDAVWTAAWRGQRRPPPILRAAGVIESGILPARAKPICAVVASRADAPRERGRAGCRERSVVRPSICLRARLPPPDW